MEEFVTIKILKDKTEGTVPEKIFVEITRGDKAWSSGKVAIDGLGEVIEVQLRADKPNAFNVLAYTEQGDMLPSEPSGFTIIQGSKIGSATLPYNIGIEIRHRSSGKLGFKSIKGLEKNQSTPATGATNGLKTQKNIRPGIIEDSIKIPIYQGEYGADGTRAIHNDHVYDLIITGEDLPKLLPEGGDVELTLKVDKSERMSASVYFPVLDYTFETAVPTDTRQKEVDASWLDSEINKALHTLDLLKQESSSADHGELGRLEDEISEIKKRFKKGRTDYDRKKDVLDSLRRSLKKLDAIQDSREWPKTEEELKDVYYRLEKTNRKFGDAKTTSIVEQLKEHIPEVIAEKNVKMAQEMISNMRQLDFSLVDKGLGARMEIIMLQNFNEDFDTFDWSDRNRARMTLDRGLQLAVDNPSKERLRQVVLELYQLLPDTDQPILGGGDGSELIG